MLKIIPEPQKIKINKGFFLFGKKLKFFAGKEQLKTVKRLSSFLKNTYNLNLEFVESSFKNNMLIIGENFSEPEFYNLRKSESYTLDISSEIVIEGADQAGVFYGAMTLMQMLEDGLSLPKVCIKDAPAMKIRAEHWDLKGMMPTFSYLKKRLLDLSKYKINAILAEYEDKFELEKHPLIASPIALSKKQIKELQKIAKDNFIDIIPLVQSLGHAEYVLKHKEYSYVAESSDNCQQYCATNPATFELFKEFMDEIMPLHPSKYVHVGGDETRQLGECPKCAAVVKKEGKIGLYFKQIKKVCDYVVSIGKIPIIWDDMLCRNFRKDLLQQLPSETIIMPWSYGIKGERSPVFLGPDHTMSFSNKWLQKVYKDETQDILNILQYYILNGGEKASYENIPESNKKVFEKYLKCKDFPKYFNAVPAIPLVKDAGLNFLGAGAAQCSLDGKFMPDSDIRIANLKAWSKIIATQKGIGLVATEWARSGTLAEPNAPFDSRWHVVMAMAEHSWTGGKTDDKEFDLKFNWRMFGLNDLRLTNALFFLRNPNDSRFSNLAAGILKAVREDVKRNMYIFDVFLNTAGLIKLETFYTKLWNKQYKNWLYKLKNNTLHETMLSTLERSMNHLNNEAKACKKNTIKLLSKNMYKQEVKEYVECVFSPIEDFLKTVYKLIKKNKKGNKNV
jgi:Glycosyl hydrolase family 20, catalytic domain/Glycosyl hydrolase family 20, domain 2